MYIYIYIHTYIHIVIYCIILLHASSEAAAENEARRARTCHVFGVCVSYSFLCMLWCILSHIIGCACRDAPRRITLHGISCAHLQQPCTLK